MVCEKTHEYRETTEYWIKRLTRYYHAHFHILCPEKRLICFACGYPNKDDKDKRIYAKIKNIEVVWGADTDLKIQKKVFDIEFELIKE